MTTTATLKSVGRSAIPESFELAVEYLDSTKPDWRAVKTLLFTPDLAATGAQQRAAVLALITVDAQRYQKQAAIEAGLQSLIGQTVTLV